VSGKVDLLLPMCGLCYSLEWSLGLSGIAWMKLVSLLAPEVGVSACSSVYLPSYASETSITAGMSTFLVFSVG